MRLGDLGDTLAEQEAVARRYRTFVDCHTNPCGCHTWDGAMKDQRSGYSYPRFTVKGRDVSARRLAVVLTEGFLEDDTRVTCQPGCDPRCVRRDHLIVTPGFGSALGQRAARAGERHPNAILTREQVVALRRRAAAGEKVADLAAEYGIATRSAQAIVAGKRRPWDGGPIRPVGRRAA